jgi:hypothetical protein
MVAFLCSERASYIAGRSITVDGPGARPARKTHATPHCLCYPEKEIGSAAGGQPDLVRLGGVSPIVRPNREYDCTASV